LIHAVPPELPSCEGISWTDNGVIRLALLIRATGPAAPTFRVNARGWFSAVGPGRSLSRGSLSCQPRGRLLVPVNAF